MKSHANLKDLPVGAAKGLKVRLKAKIPIIFSPNSSELAVSLRPSWRIDNLAYLIYLIHFVFGSHHAMGRNQVQC